MDNVVFVCFCVYLVTHGTMKICQRPRPGQSMAKMEILKKVKCCSSFDDSEVGNLPFPLSQI